MLTSSLDDEDIVAEIEGKASSILTAERTALNFPQRMSGIATLTNGFAERIKYTKAKILDTRKTVPGLRLVDKEAVLLGGGQNRRIGLFDLFLIKDGRAALSETISLPVLEPGVEHAVQSKFTLAAPATGAYAIRAGIGKERPLGTAAAAFTVLPTLVLRGSLDGTPSIAAPCRPFTVRYDVRNAGTVPALTGSVKVDLLPGNGTPAFSRQLPLSEKPQAVTIEKKDLPRGPYTLRLSASGANERPVKCFRYARGICRVYWLATFTSISPATRPPPPPAANHRPSGEKAGKVGLSIEDVDLLAELEKCKKSKAAKPQDN